MLKKMKKDPGMLAMMMINLSAQITYAGFDQVDLVIEAVIENVCLIRDSF